MSSLSEKDLTNEPTIPSDEKYDSSDNYSDAVNPIGQDQTKQKSLGVLRTEIYSKQYNTPIHKAVVFIGVFLVAYAYGLDSTVRSVNVAKAQSSYNQHSLLSTINCIQAVIAAAGQIAFARISDVFGRLTLCVFALVFYIIGTVIESQATNVQKFAAGAVFYSLGLTVLSLLLEIVASDFSHLNWRVVASFVVASPFIINTWVSGDITTHFNENNWSWGIGMWAFIVPLSCIPLFAAMSHMVWKARKSDELTIIKEKQKEVVTRLGYRKYVIEKFFWELDVVGLLLTISTFGLILVPFTLAGGVQSQWKKAKIVVPLVLGFVVSLPLFVLWEAKFAKVPLVPKHLIRDRGVFSALAVAVLVNFIWYQQGDFMYSVLIVANNESVKSATRITSLYSFTSVITGFIVGAVITRVRRLKPFAVFGTFIWLLSFGLLIKFRGGDSATHSGVIGSLCLLGFGAGFLTYVTQASIQTCANHQHMAVILSLFLASYSIGTALGATVSGALWTNILPGEIAKRLSDPELVALAYGSPFKFILTYTWETPERQAVVEAYRYIQKILCTVGACLCVLLIGFACFLRDHKLQSVVAIDEVEEKGQKLEDDQDFIVDFFKKLFHKN